MTHTRERKPSAILPSILGRSDWIPVASAVLLVLAQIGYPLASGDTRDRVTVLVVLLSAGTAMAHAAVTRGVGFGIGFVMTVSCLGLLAEILGTTTGFPFGAYTYAAGGLGPAIAGVPLVVALAWAGGLYPVWVVAGVLSRGPFGRIVRTAIGAVGWDLFLDPQMVADGHWTWRDVEPGPPGLDIPYTNYLGWFGVALVLAGLLYLPHRWFPAPDGRSARADLVLPTVLFGWTWLGSVVAHAVFLGLPWSAVYGGVGMGILGVPLVWRLATRGTLDPMRAPLPR